MGIAAAAAVAAAALISISLSFSLSLQFLVNRSSSGMEDNVVECIPELINLQSGLQIQMKSEKSKMPLLFS